MKTYLRGLAVLALIALVPSCARANTIYFHGVVYEVTTHYSGGPGTSAWAVRPPAPPVSVGSPISVFLTLPDSAPGQGYFSIGCSSGDWSLHLINLYYPSSQYAAFMFQMGASIQQAGPAWSGAFFFATDRNNDPYAWWTFNAIVTRAATVPDAASMPTLLLASLLGLIACRHRIRVGLA